MAKSLGLPYRRPTEFIVIGSQHQRSKVNISGIRVGTGVIPPSDTVRNLGIILDSNLSMDRHISAVSRAAFMSLRNIGMVRNHINDHVAELLSHAYITSRLDMGNSALYKLNKSQLNRLQRLQNNAARVVTLSKKSVSISSLLKQLHWLPIEQRI